MGKTRKLYTERILEIEGFVYPLPSTYNNGEIHDDIITKLSYHLLNLFDEWSQNKKIELIVPKNRHISYEEIKDLSKNFFEVWEKGNTPVLMANHISYKVILEGYHGKGAECGTWGETDLIAIIPSYLMLGSSSENEKTNHSNTYCLIGEIKETYGPGNRPIYQINSAIDNYFDPFFGHPFNIIAFDGFLVTPEIIDRVCSKWKYNKNNKKSNNRKNHHK